MYICVARVVMYQRVLACSCIVFGTLFCLCGTYLCCTESQIANCSVPPSPGLFLTPEKVALTQRGVKGRLQPNIDPFPAPPICLKKKSPPKYQVINQRRNCYQSLSRINTKTCELSAKTSLGSLGSCDSLVVRKKILSPQIQSWWTYL